MINIFSKTLFSSKTDQWETPQYLFDKLDEVFEFNLDPCSDIFNHKCVKYFTRRDNGLVQDWGGNTVFCNPPYGSTIKEWIKKCLEESKKPNTVVVMLIPARTDTKYAHELVFSAANYIGFMNKRPRFGNSKQPAPFPCQLVIYGNIDSSININNLDDIAYWIKLR